MVNKTTQAKEFWLSGDKQKALRIFKTFRLGLSKEEKRAIEIHHEVVSGGKTSFYESLGIDLQDIKEQAESVIENKLINQ